MAECVLRDLVLLILGLYLAHENHITNVDGMATSGFL